LTGRENVFLSGAILGMNRKEIKKRFDEIISFAGVEKFVDTPVKRYSSGMYVRLGFSVAAHLDTEILLVDEVLAVGDLKFQEKCIKKIGEETTSGKTTILVSHNLGTISKLSDSVIVLEAGKKVHYSSPPQNALNFYKSSLDILQTQKKVFSRKKKDYGKDFKIVDCNLIKKDNSKIKYLLFKQPLIFEIVGKTSDSIERLAIGVRIENEEGIPLLGPRSSDQNIFYAIGNDTKASFIVYFEGLYLSPGSYWVTLTALHGSNIIDQVEKVIRFEVIEEIYHKAVTPYSGAWGAIQVAPIWKKLN